MKKLYQRFEAIFLTIVIVMGLADVVPVCKVEAAGTVLSSEEVADYFKGRVGSLVTQASCLAFIADGFQALGAPSTALHN